MRSSLLLTLLLSSLAVAQPPVRISPLKINEIYFTGSFTGGLLAPSDQYIELYNTSPNAPVFLDGMMIVSFGAGVKAQGGAINSTNIQAFKFPGNPGGHVYMVAPGAFQVIAVNAQDFTSKKGLNLSGADWEFYAGFLDAQNPAPDLTPLGAGLFGIHTDFSMSTSDDAIALCDGTDTTLTDGINVVSILDAVEYHAKGMTQKLLPMQLDQGTAGAGAVLGISIERKTAGYDSDNSTNDFDTTKPTPGFQHGANGQGPLKVLPDIDPLSLWNYKLYDEYTVDTNNVRQDSTLRSASTSIRDTMAVMGGLHCANVTDSAMATAGATKATVTQEYLRNTNGTDISQYADAAFWNMYLGPAGSFITLQNQWLPLYKGSAGYNVPYPISTIDTTLSLPFNGTNVSVAVKGVISGKWAALDTVTVPMGTFPCYVFKINVQTSATAAGLISLFNNSFEQTVWVARDIGVVKSLTPPINFTIAALNQTVSQPGVERDLRALGLVTAVHDARAVPAEVTLADVYPNPFSKTATLAFGLPSAAHVAIKMFDLSGNLVRTLFNGLGNAGTTTLNIQSIGLACGNYVVTFESGNQTQSRLVTIHP